MACNVDLPSSIQSELADRSSVSSQADKKNYAEAFSRRLATRVANVLRRDFDGILPGPRGEQQESRARTTRGYKRLDVNYSKPEIGLGLGVSIKTINFRDQKSGRYTKNFTRIDNELRAEAHDYHERQPFAVMISLIFLPVDACDDGTAAHPSSFGQAVRIFRVRAGRERPQDSAFLFEGVFVGLYQPAGAEQGAVGFFDVAIAPPRVGRPSGLLSFEEVISRIREIYDLRNAPPFEWAEDS